MTTNTASTPRLRNEQTDSELYEFLVDELKDIYWAEQHLVEALPKMEKAATSNQLKEAFRLHTEETKTHVDTLERVFEALGEEAAAKKCEAMAGLLAEAETIMGDTEAGTMVRDAGLILAAQKVEHYEIGTYGTLRTFAKHLGHEDVQQLLQQTLDNEKETDQALTKIAETFVNEEAAGE